MPTRDQSVRWSSEKTAGDPPARLGRDDYAIDAQRLAQRLLGCALVRVLDDGQLLRARIVETEAYVGVNDRASHAYSGRRTERNEPMYAPPGYSYVYFTYGMHYCFNVVCASVNEPAAVLVRAAEPIAGIEAMRARRTEGRASRSRSPAGPKPIVDIALCKGPACLCEALGIDRELNGTDMTSSSVLFIEQPCQEVNEAEVVRTPRIGVDNAGDWALAELRWLIATSRSVSGPKRYL